jgi:fermentation-respiration switch protein FrsA (DUF1100 family)
MNASTRRAKVHFASGDALCAAWHYRGTNGACVIMAGGLAVTKEPGTDLFAKVFNGAGYTVLAFDYRHMGESGGHPRQVARIHDQLADWDAAIAHAQTLPEVDPARIAIWGFSLSGGHIFPVAASNPRLASAIAQTPLVDGHAATRQALRHTTPRALLRLTARAILDTIGGAIGRNPLMVPLAGERGTVAMISSPDGLRGDGALNPGNKYPDWQQQVAARSTLRLGTYRPGRHAARIQCPLLVLVFDQDGVAPADCAARAARRAPRGELVRRPGGHYEPFLAAHDEAVEIELAFLDRHLLTTASPPRAASRSLAAAAR